MSRISSRKSGPRSPHTKKQLEMLKALEAAARRQGLRVSSGQLRFAGLKLKSGSCLLRGRPWLILDRTQPFDDLLEVYRQALDPDQLTGPELSEELRRLLTPYPGGAGSGRDDRAA